MFKVHGNSKRRTIKNEALKGASVSRRRDSSMSNETQSSASAITTESPFIDGSSLPDTTSVETLETESHTNVEAVEEVGQVCIEISLQRFVKPCRISVMCVLAGKRHSCRR